MTNNKFSIPKPANRTYTLVTKSGLEFAVQTPALAEAQKIFKTKYSVNQMLRIKDERGKVVWRNSSL